MLRKITLGLWVAGLLLPSVQVRAQAESSALRGWGPQIGISSHPDQFYLGAHFDLGRLSQNLRVRPVLDLGAGDGSETFNARVDLSHPLRGNWQAWTPYLGGGVGVVFRGRDDALFSNGSRSDLGLGAFFGLQRGSSDHNMRLEMRLGLVEEPTLKLGLGWTFY